MDKDSFNKLIEDAGRYFPSLSLFWVLDKTNQILDFFVLLLALSFLIVQKDIINLLISKIGRKKLGNLLAKKEEGKAMNLIVDKLPRNFFARLCYVLMLILNFFFILYAYCRLIPLWGLHIAKFLILVSVFFFSFAIGNYFYNLSIQIPRALKEFSKRTKKRI